MEHDERVFQWQGETIERLQAALLDAMLAPTRKEARAICWAALSDPANIALAFALTASLA